MGLQYVYSFASDVAMAEVADALRVAALAAEAIHGRASIQMDAAFCLDESGRRCTIDGSSVVGEHIARVFTGLLSRQLGEETFRVTRGDADEALDGEPSATPRSASC